MTITIVEYPAGGGPLIDEDVPPHFYGIRINGLLIKDIELVQLGYLHEVIKVMFAAKTGNIALSNELSTLELAQWLMRYGEIEK